MKLKLATVLIGFLLGIQAFAQSERGGVGNGGCSSCQESFRLGTEIAKELVYKGTDRVNKIVPLIHNVNDFYSTAMMRKVLPGNPEEMNGRTAISYAGQDLTIIDINAYMKMSKNEKILLEIHEILVLMGIEIDGVYMWSNELVKLILEYNFRGTYSCDNNYCYLTNPKALVIENGVEKEYYFDLRNSSSVGKICKFFNLGEVVYREGKTVEEPTIILNTFGHIQLINKENKKKKVFSLVKCERR